MQKQINVVYNPIIIGLFSYSNCHIIARTINGVQYLVNEKQLRKARISLRAKIPIADLLVDNEVYDFNDLAVEKQEEIKAKLMDKLTFSAQEIYMFCCLLDLYLSNYPKIDFTHIHSNIRSLGRLDLENERDFKTLYAYKNAIKKLKNKILRVEIEQCNPRIYGVSNKNFTQNLLLLEEDRFNLGNLAYLISLSGQYSDEYMSQEIFNCRLNQMSRFLLAYIISYEIYSYKRNNPHIKYYEVKMQTLMKKIPYFRKNGTNSNMNMYQYIQSSKSKTQIINRFYRNCIEILDIYTDNNIISSYHITPDLKTVSVKDFEKIKFCVNLLG